MARRWHKTLIASLGALAVSCALLLPAQAEEDKLKQIGKELTKAVEKTKKALKPAGKKANKAAKQADKAVKKTGKELKKVPDKLKKATER